MSKIKGKRNLIVVGSRGSQLAKTQSQQVLDLLRELNPEIEFRLEIIQTTGDVDTQTPLNRFAAQGVFIAELEKALASGQIDAAIHSYKDLPGEGGHPDLEVASVPKREDARDAWISKSGSLIDLKVKGKVGTGAARRIVQLQKLRPDFLFENLRGNVDTRLKKAETGELDAVILACAGLKRLGWEHRITHPISLDEVIPAVGQGALALQCRSKDDFCREILHTVNHKQSRMAVDAERHFMRRLGGGCKAPLAAHVEAKESGWVFRAALGNENPTVDKNNLASVRVEAKGTDMLALAEAAIESLRLKCRDLDIIFPKLAL